MLMVDLENPMIIGDYYVDELEQLDTPEARREWVEEKHLEHRAAAFGLRVQSCCVEAIQDQLVEVYSIFVQRGYQDKVDEWIDELVNSSRYEMMYHEWLLAKTERSAS